jgi:hypothetical protein
MSLIQFPSTPDSGLPPARHALLRHLNEKVGISDKIAKIKGSRASLADALNVFDSGRDTVDRMIDEDARSIFDRLMAGIGASLSSVGDRAVAMNAKLEASQLQAEAGRRTIAMFDGELERLEGALADLNARTPDMVKAAVREAYAPLDRDWSAVVEDMRRLMVMLAGLQQFMATEEHNYVPDVRLIANVPDFAGAGSEVIAHTVQVDAAAACFQAFATQLAVDPRTPAPEIAIGNERDELTYDRLSRAEKRQADRDFTLTTHTRETVDSRNFAQQIRDAAQAALGL